MTAVTRKYGEMLVELQPHVTEGRVKFAVTCQHSVLQYGDFAGTLPASLEGRVTSEMAKEQDHIFQVFQQHHAMPRVKICMLMSQYYALKCAPSKEAQKSMQANLQTVFMTLAPMVLSKPTDLSPYHVIRPDEWAHFFVYLILENPSRDEPYQALAAAEPNVIRLTMECLPIRFHELGSKHKLMAFLDRIKRVFPAQPPAEISSCIEIYLGLSLLHGMLSPFQHPITKAPGKKISSTIRHIYTLLRPYVALLGISNKGGRQLSALEKALLYQFNTTFALERALLGSLNRVKRGVAYWKQHAGEVGEEPPLPFFASRLFAGVCPLTDRPMLHHTVLLIPTTLNGDAVTLKNMGQRTPVMLAHKDEAFIAPFLEMEEEAHWVVFISLPCEGSWQKRVKELPLPYRLPTLWEAASANLVEHKTPQTRILLCQEARSGRVATLSTQKDDPYRYHTAPAIPETEYKEVTVVLELTDTNVGMLTF